MKHRALSMLLALVMVVSLLPIAAVAGNAGVSTTAEVYEGNLEMRYDGSIGNGKSMPVGEHKIELRLWRNDTDGARWLEKADKVNLQVDGTVVKSIAYSLEENPENSNETIGFWKIVIAGSVGDSGYIQYGTDTTNRVTVTVVDDSSQGSDDMQPGTFVVQYDGENYAAGSTLALPVGPDNVVALMVRTENGWNLIDSNSSIKFENGVIANIVPVEKDDEDSDQLWRIIIKESAEEGASSWIQYGEDENNRVNIKVRPAPQPSGQLEVNYDGSYVRILTFGAGTYDVELSLRDESNNSDWRLGEKYENRLSVDGTTVQSIEQDRFEDDEGHDVFMWKITVSAPENGSASGWIQYSDGKNTSRVDIKVLAAHGSQVSDGDFIDAEVDNGELIIKMGGETYRSNVVKINWPENSDNEYYLAACEWKRTLNDLTPKGNGSRGLAKGENDHMYISTRVFQLVSGMAGSEDASYLVREDIRQEMIKDGYEFKVVLHPIDGNENYPTRETVERECLSSESENVALDWEHIYYGDPTTAGWWAYEAQLVKKTGEGEIVVARSFSSEEYQNMQKDSLTLETRDADEISRLIEKKLEEYESVPDNEIQAVEFFLPAGTIEGKIIIPKTRCFVNLVGAGNKQGVISTTIKGGVELKGADCDLILIHFVGAGKDKETWGAETPNAGLSNAAVYGSGEGIPRYCILEGYYCAVSSEDRSSWAANHSVFLDNHIGIRMMGLDGGNLQMLDNWFVRNDIAVQVDKCPLAALENTHNCFVNNEYDLINDSGMTLWMSQNFFYHDYDVAVGATPSAPTLWYAVDGDESVLNFYHNKNGDICAYEEMPEFNETANYNALNNGKAQYIDFLPWFDGESKTMAYPLARTQECVSFFYPNWRDPDFCPQWWPDNDPYYPSYVQQGVTISENELDGLRFSSYDSETDTAVGTFEFSASAAETEH